MNKMCGILGIYNEKGIKTNEIYLLTRLIESNKQRGTKGFGVVTEHEVIKSKKNVDSVHWFGLFYKYVGEKYIFCHLRSPTGDDNVSFDVTQPIVYKDTILLHNGILQEYPKEFASDTQYMAKTIHENGLVKSLELFKGTFTIVAIQPETISLFRSVNSMFTKHEGHAIYFSSAKHEGFIEFKHTTLLDIPSGKTKTVKTLVNLYDF